MCVMGDTPTHIPSWKFPDEIVMHDHASMYTHMGHPYMYHYGT